MQKEIALPVDAKGREVGNWRTLKKRFDILVKEKKDLCLRVLSNEEYVKLALPGIQLPNDGVMDADVESVFNCATVLEENINENHSSSSTLLESPDGLKNVTSSPPQVSFAKPDELEDLKLKLRT